MPLVTLSQQEYVEDALSLVDQLKCSLKGDVADCCFEMTDLCRLDLYTEPGLMRQIDPLKDRLSRPYHFDRELCDVSRDSGGRVEIQGDCTRILNGDFVDSVRHYYQRRVSLDVSDRNSVIDSPFPALSSHFLRILLSDLAYLSALDQVQVTTSQNVIGCIEERIREIVLTDKAVNDLLGYDLSHEQIVTALHYFGYTIRDEGDGSLHVEIPFHRVDIASESDVIEDIMLYYLSLFKGGSIVQVCNPEEYDFELVKKRTAKAKLVDGLVSFGFKQVNTPALKKDSRTRNYKLRSSLLSSFLEYEQRRQHVTQPHFVFELGPVRNSDNLSDHLGLGIVGNNVDFNYLFSVIYYLVFSVTGQTIVLKPVESDNYERGKAFVIYSNDQLIGEIGIVSTGKIPRVKLRSQCMYAELNLPDLI